MNKRFSRSLKLRLFFVALGSVAVAATVFTVTFFLGGILLDKTVYGDAFSESMAQRQFSKLQDYVEDESVSLDNLQRLNAWVSRENKVYLVLYNDDTLIYESPIPGHIKSQIEADNYNPGTEDPNNEFTLELDGGTRVRTFLYYYAGNAFYFLVIIMSGILAFIAFSFVFVISVNKKVSYITQLTQELDILSGGQLEYPVTITGKDELSELASGIDLMRKSIILHQKIEKQMRSANSELITSMSHDLRTPLTALLAYLEIIERKKYSSEEQMNNLIHKSVNQTMRIKEMADKLFQYFLVYATEWEQTETEEVDAEQLLSQALEEYTDALESKGMKVNTDFSPVSGTINVNVELLRRVLDNLYSNLIKYADVQKHIEFICTSDGQNLILTIANSVSPTRGHEDSTCIGLNTCRRIIEFHSGTFNFSEANGIFTVTVTLPLSPNFTQHSPAE